MRYEMSTSNIESLIDSAECLILSIGYFLDSQSRKELLLAIESLSVETRKAREEMASFSAGRMLALEKEIDDLLSDSSTTGEDNIVGHQDNASNNKSSETFLVGVEISIDKLIDIYGSVNNSSCSQDKAVKILNYIAKNYDGTISVYRFAENVCLDLHDDSVLDLLMLSGEI
jgi:hypothetical protein